MTKAETLADFLLEMSYRPKQRNIWPNFLTHDYNVVHER